MDQEEVNIQVQEQPLAASVEVVEANESAEKFEPDATDRALVQALLFAHGEPLEIERLAKACELSKEQLVQVCDTLQLALECDESGLTLVRIGDAYQLRTKPQYAEKIRVLKASAPKRLSAPALETLAIIAYRQPIIKSDVERIRGVDATPTMKTLLERNLIKIIGHQPTVGQPALYGTTDEFLKLFGLSSLEQLPTLKDLKELDSDPGEASEENQENQIDDNEAVENNTAIQPQ